MPFPNASDGTDVLNLQCLFDGNGAKLSARLADDCQAKQLWRSAKVASQRGPRVRRSVLPLFSALKVVLAARSPVFADMLSSDTEEAHTNRIVINDVSPPFFKLFLCILYISTWSSLLSDGVALMQP